MTHSPSPSGDKRELVERLKTALERATPTVDGLRHWPATEEHSERYTVAGVPCGFTVASFGDANDAALFLVAKRDVPSLLAELESLQARLSENDWQPIETAPKDAEILIWDGFAVFHGFWNGGWSTYYGLMKRPWSSHWKPLPEPPASRFISDRGDEPK